MTDEERLQAQLEIISGISQTGRRRETDADKIGIVGLWAVLFPIVLALGWFVLGIPLLDVVGFYFTLMLFVVMVG